MNSSVESDELQFVGVSVSKFFEKTNDKLKFVGLACKPLLDGQRPICEPRPHPQENKLSTWSHYA